MKQSYISIHENEGGEIVLTYIGYATFGEQVTPEVMVINSDDAKNIAEALVNFRGEQNG